MTTERPVGASTAVLAAFCITLAGALVEVVVLYTRRIQDPMFHVGPDFAWMAPVGLMAAVLVATIAGLLVTLVWRSAGVVLMLFGSVALVLLNVLLLVRGLSEPAAALLAMGGAVQITRWLGRSEPVAQILRRWAPLAAGGFGVACAAIWLASARPEDVRAASLTQPTRPPNVLLITLDTVRAASLSLYGYSRQTSPNLERFAARGVVFDKAFSVAPWTLPSHASLFTGRWAHELSTGYSTPLDATFPTLAEYLHAKGYATAGFVANLGYCGYGTGLGRGFGHYEDFQRSIGEVANSSTLVRKIADNFTFRRLIENDQHLNRIDAGDLNDRVLSWLSAHESTPSFVFVNYFDAHEPYLPPASFARKFGSGRARGRHSALHHWLWDPNSEHLPLSAAEQQEEVDAYDGAIAYLDSRLGELLDGLERRGTLTNTLIVITADHGEELGEHGLYDHGYSLYRPALQVPLVIVSPQRVPPGRRVSVPVSLRDVPATIVSLLGMASGAPFPGRSLATHWDAVPEAEGMDVVLSEVGRAPGQPDWFPASQGDMVSALLGGVRCIRDGRGREQLFDVEADPWERRDLAPLPEFQEAMLACRAAMDRTAAGRHTNATEETRP
jgi:arylsulfatase A-like enzyme